MSDLVGDMYSSDEWRVHIEDDLRMERTFEHVTEDCQCEGKFCGKCQSTKCRKAFNYNNRSKGQLKSQCRDCTLSYQKNYYQSHAEDIKKRSREFHQAHRDYNLSKMKDRYSRMKEHDLAHDRAHYYANHQQALANKRKSYYRNVQVRRAQKRAQYYAHHSYYSAAQKAWRASRKEHVQNYSRQYKQSHRTLFRLIQNKRRLRLHSGNGSFTTQQWEALKEQYDHRCLCCGEQVELTIDHVVPISKDGTNYIDNIQPLCRSCNARKGTKIIDYRF